MLQKCFYLCLIFSKTYLYTSSKKPFHSTNNSTYILSYKNGKKTSGLKKILLKMNKKTTIEYTRKRNRINKNDNKNKGRTKM